MPPRGPNILQNGGPRCKSRGDVTKRVEVDPKKLKLLQNQKRSQGVPVKTEKECPKATPIIDGRGLKTMLLQKYCFYNVKLSVSLLPQTRFLWPRANECQPERDPREGPGAPRRPFQNFRWCKRAQKGSERSPRGGLEGPSGAQQWQK